MRPYGWKSPKTVFTNSMSDLFHKDVPIEFISRVFETMNNTPRHTYQVLTKRADRLAEIAPLLKWTPNIWMGVSIEDNRVISRLKHLKSIPAAIKFISAEPLIGPLSNIDLNGIDWVIVGGESGPGARPMEKQWVVDIKDQCRKYGTSFFFKQWGGVRKKSAGRLLDGVEYNEYPSPKEQVNNLNEPQPISLHPMGAYNIVRRVVEPITSSLESQR